MGWPAEGLGGVEQGPGVCSPNPCADVPPPNRHRSFLFHPCLSASKADRESPFDKLRVSGFPSLIEREKIRGQIYAPEY